MSFRLPDLKINRGQAFSFDLLLADEDGDPIDTAEFSYVSEIRSAGGGTLYETFTITASPSQNGTVALSLTTAEVAALTAFGTAYYDLRVTDLATGVVEVSEKAFVFLATPITAEPA